MVHLLHRLYGVDAPAIVFIYFDIDYNAFVCIKRSRPSW